MEVLTARQQREREYYNKFAANFDVENCKVDLSPVEGPLRGTERRPWNSYWALYEKALLMQTSGARLLDFGSGPGDNGLRFACMGYQVTGFDISEANIAIAKALFRKHGMSGEFSVENAESLPYADNCFDMVVGVDILHHVDIPRALKECYRVLKPGGKALFREPVEAPFWDWLRNTKPVLGFAPKESSLELHITEDERKLNALDEAQMRIVFGKISKSHFVLLSRFDRFFREGKEPRPSFLEKIDFYLNNTFPWLGKFSGAVIYELEK